MSGSRVQVIVLGALLSALSGPGCSTSPTPGGSTGAADSSGSGSGGSTMVVATEDSADGSSSSGSASGCPIAGVMGGEPGQIVPSVPVSFCDGTTIQLPELVCGHPLTLIDIGGAAFDICVDATMEYATDPAYDELQARGLQIVQIFALDDQNNIPSTTFCSQYAEMHDVDFEFMIDQIGATHTLAPNYPFNIVVDPEGQVIHKWTTPLPDDKVEILSALLDEAM